MFKLNLKIAFRNLWRNKTASFINIIGLAIGLASCLMLLLYVSYEWNFDKHFKEAGQVYQVMTNFKDANGKITGTGDVTGNVIAGAIKEEIPGVEAISRLGYGGQSLIANGPSSFKKEAKFADPDILKIYNYEFIAGNPGTALNDPGSVVLTERMAKLLFPNGDALNQSVRYDDKTNLKVSGVIKDLPSNTSNRFDFLMPWSFYETLFDWVKDPSWTNFNWQTLVKLDKNADLNLVNLKMKGMMERHQKDTRAESFLYPLSEKHLYGKFENGKGRGGDVERIYLFAGLALGILLIACVNFMNMATAKSEKRAKEVGIKKTIGAGRGSLIAQFFLEAMLLTLIGVVAAIAMVELLLPTFNNLLHIQLSVSGLAGGYWLWILLIVLVTGLLSGSYPALYLSSFDPIQTLKKKAVRAKAVPMSLRHVLVVGQFCFALLLIIATLVIYKQLSFIKNRPLGYDTNLLVEMPQDGLLQGKYELLRTSLLKSGAVTSMCQSSMSISNEGSNFWNFEWPGMADQDKQIVFNQIATTYNFIETNGIKLIQGRDFSRNYASDTAGVLLSSSAVKIMNLKHPLGTKVKYHGQNAVVIGVFKDFIWGSPFYRDRPMVVAYSKDWNGVITMRLNPANGLSQNIDLIKTVAKNINPAYPVEIKLVNDLYANKLQAENTLGILSNLFGGLSIFVSCLGLFGLAAYSAEQRTKEFGVRKVLGASMLNLMQLLSLSFMKMIFISVVIAIPLGYYLMGKWLMKFEFHTTISWWIIGIAAIGTLFIALLTVSFQAYKSARANPVDALKYE
jgi:putative ABC transport system permease protein